MRQFRDFAFGLAALGLTALASASEAPASEAPISDAESHVHVLEKATFNDFMEQHPLVMAEFYAPWCGHCKALAPEYEAAAADLKEKNILLAKIDCTAERELCKEYDVEGYPTIKIFRGLQNVKPYNGARKSEAISSFMSKQALPTVSQVTMQNFEDVKAMDKVVVVGYFASDDKTSNNTFHAVAEALRDDFLFSATSDPEMAAAANVKHPAVILYKDFDGGKELFSGKFAEEDITNFVKVYSMPLVGEIGPDTYNSYMGSGLPLGYLFAETPEEREEFTAMLKPIAKKYKGRINLGTIDAKAYGAHSDNLNLKPEKFPAFAIHNPAENKKFPYDQEKKITRDDLAAFVQAVLNGEIEASIKSEPVPASQEGPVTVVVAHTYQEIVINSDKDVLLEFYAPWCGHCKALAPKYEQLAKLYADDPEFASKVIIAKIDATANDVPDEIQGFPTVKLFPAGAKDSPIEYRGMRTIKELAQFVRDNGKYSVDAYDPEKVDEDSGDVTKKPAEESPSSTEAAAKETKAESTGKPEETAGEATRHEEL
ncbi:disulfidisomerase [Histoplasma capsulatum]|uniref:Protein disulfide-isomerase n=1 Tax=Ajellomyces capsulatus TaxID=5037 RepID=A0A8A1MBB9_AJECA|nr:protein disulfide-isomerase precursor [Histoplasma mississippiense (nom. inval.)]EDN07099.1 protein disulfide-isomerase precursor [Histoplasma mississippiense (nom. inval.)]QSS61457.1 disulfidisomerase [Histoplasma capsulatum]